MRRAGGALVCRRARSPSLRREGGVWQVQAGGAALRGAAGGQRRRRLGRRDRRGSPARGRSACSRRRRSAFIFAPPEGVASAAWPMTAGVERRLVLQARRRHAARLAGQRRPGARRTTCSPKSSTSRIAIDRIERMTTLTIRRPTRTWAGLRSFVADGDLVGGFDPELPGFFWVGGAGRLRHPDLAGHGPGRSRRWCAASRFPAHVAGFGLTAAMLSPVAPARALPPEPPTH